jgi:hypothetical protein
MKKTFLLILVLISLKAFSQSVSGYWYGSAFVQSNSSTNNYLVELILHQNKTQVKGILNYYFKRTYRSIKVNGNYNSLTRELSINNVPLTIMARLKIWSRLHHGFFCYTARVKSQFKYYRHVSRQTWLPEYVRLM